MSNWVLTKGLQHLRNEVDYAFPDRSKASDGTIGDAAHMAETSGHNPDDTPGSKAEYNDHDGIPEVRAWDCTSAFGDGVDAQDVVDHLRALPGLSSVIRYMIYNRKIYEASNGWKPAAYTGPSAHTEHIHFSGARSQAADNNNTYNYRLEEIPVALTAADKTWIQQQIAGIPQANASKVHVDLSTPASGLARDVAASEQRIVQAVTAALKQLAAGTSAGPSATRE